MHLIKKMTTKRLMSKSYKVIKLLKIQTFMLTLKNYNLVKKMQKSQKKTENILNRK